MLKRHQSRNGQVRLVSRDQQHHGAEDMDVCES